MQSFQKSILIFLLTCIVGSTQAQIQRQQQSMWCWASCIQSCLYQANYPTNQASIVGRLTGWPHNRPAHISEVVMLLNSYNLKAWSVNQPANPMQLYNTLSGGWKVIAFVNPTNNNMVGHFILLQGIAPNGNIIISDPYTGATYQQSIQQLYYAWKWSMSVVVGKP